MMNIKRALTLLMCIFFLAGCSHTLHKRAKDESDHLDQGSETKFQLRGPRAAIKHTF